MNALLFSKWGLVFALACYVLTMTANYTFGSAYAAPFLAVQLAHLGFILHASHRLAKEQGGMV